MELWKPSDALTPADFEAHPLWGYDAARAAQDPESDEAWVRPYALDSTPAESDLLFGGGTLRTGKGDVLRGAVLFVFEGGRPRVAGVALLEPSYLALGFFKGKVTEDDREELEAVLPGALPLAYEASVDVAGRAIRLSGAVS
jgi:hypothetical protein